MTPAELSAFLDGKQTATAAADLTATRFSREEDTENE